MALRIVGLVCLLLDIAVAAPLAPHGFAFSGLANRFVTPNGDGKNDTAVFRFDNPRDTGGTIRIYEIGGRQVASLSIEGNTTSATWDPRGYANGVYIYVISIEDASLSGVLVVLR